MITVANKSSLASTESPLTTPAQSTSEQRLSAFASHLRERGLRATSERRAVLRVLLACGTHPSAEAVLAAVRELQPSMSSSTVYSTLNLLVEMGEVLEISTHGGKRYDACRPVAHPHLVCAKCHEVSDADVPISSHHQMLARTRVEQKGYRFLDCRIGVFGVCPHCQEQERDVGTEEVARESH